jgi:hypothetical protein
VKQLRDVELTEVRELVVALPGMTDSGG